jgi:hypothetical protein
MQASFVTLLAEHAKKDSLLRSAFAGPKTVPFSTVTEKVLFDDGISLCVRPTVWFIFGIISCKYL